MKSTWGSEPVGELCEFISGLWKGEKPPFVRVSVYRNTNFTKDGTLDDSDVAELDVEARQYAKRKLQYGDIILEKSGGGPKQPVGRVALFDKQAGEYSLSNFTSAMRIREPHRVDFQYLHRFLFWQHLSGATESMQKRSTGIRNLTGDAYRAIPVPLPPLAEQRQIVGIIDEAFAAIATAKANTQKALASTRALLQPAFGAMLARVPQHERRSTTVETVAASSKDSIRTGPFGSQLLHSEFVEQGIAVLGIDNAVRNRFAWSERRYITPAKYTELKRYTVRPGDVIITIMGTCGRCAIVPDDIPLAINSKHLCCITLDHSKCLPGYLHAYFLYDPDARDFLAQKAKGSIMEGLNMGIIKELPIQLPSIELQNEIVVRFDSIHAETQRLESLAQQKLAALDALKASLLHHAFTGQLTKSSIERAVATA